MDKKLPYSLHGFKEFKVQRKKIDDMIINDEKLNTKKLSEFFEQSFVQYMKALTTFNKDDFPK